MARSLAEDQGPDRSGAPGNCGSDVRDAGEYVEHAKADADRHLKRGVEVRAQLQNMFVVLISAESEVRNYGLNGREDGIYPFSLTRAAIDPLFKKVGELMAGDREQEQRLEKLRLLVQSRFEGLKSLRDYYSSPETRSKPASEEQRAAAKISPDVILAVNELGTAESKRFQDEMKGEADRQAKLHFWIYVTEFAGLLSGVLGVVLLTGSIKRRVVRLESNAFCLAEGLPSEELVTRHDELGRLASAIERAGAVIASRSEELKLALEGGGVIIWELEPGTGRIRYHAGSEAFQSDAISGRTASRNRQRMDRDRASRGSRSHRAGSAPHCSGKRLLSD